MGLKKRPRPDEMCDFLLSVRAQQVCPLPKRLVFTRGKGRDFKFFLIFNTL